MEIYLETDRLVLREYQETDWVEIQEYAQQGEILIYEVWGPNSEKDTKDFIDIAIQAQLKEPRTTFELVIILKKENKLIGGCGFRIDKLDPKKGNIGYIINPLYWKKGYATEAVLDLINYITNSLKINLIEATCDTQNIASQMVLKKCGFIQTKLIKNHIKMKNRIRDTYVFERKTLV